MPKRDKYRKVDYDDISSMYRDGRPIKEILNNFQIKSGTLYRALDACGVTRRRARYSVHLEAMARKAVLEYSDTDKSIVTVATEFGFSAHWFYKKLKEYGKQRRSSAPRPRYTTASFIAAAKAKYGDRFDYSDVHYVNSRRKVSIKCNKCGTSSSVHPSSHLYGPHCKGCYESNRRSVDRRRWNTLDKLKLASRAVHGDKYNYLDFIDTGAETLVKLECKSCSNVWVVGTLYHMRVVKRSGRLPGCRKCTDKERGLILRKTRDKFIADSIAVHGNAYDYGNVKYIGTAEKVEIWCKACQRFFWQRPQSHIKGNNCSRCVRIRFESGSSIVSDECLTHLGIPHAQRELNIGNLMIDGFIPEVSEIVEFLGDYFHGNPNTWGKCKLPELLLKQKYRWESTDRRFIKLLNRRPGYKIRYVWEHDWYEFKRGDVDELHTHIYDGELVA